MVIIVVAKSMDISISCRYAAGKLRALLIKFYYRVTIVLYR